MNCPTGKEPFDCKGDALLAASRHTKAPKRNGGSAKKYKLRAYKCECGNWHLTKRVR